MLILKIIFKKLKKYIILIHFNIINTLKNNQNHVQELQYTPIYSVRGPSKIKPCCLELHAPLMEVMNSMPNLYSPSKI
jgi:hypothetical protein